MTHHVTSSSTLLVILLTLVPFTPFPQAAMTHCIEAMGGPDYAACTSQRHC